MNNCLQKLALIFACGTGVLYGAGTLYHVFISRHINGLSELPGIEVALSVYSAGLIMTAFLTLSSNKIGKAVYLFLISINLGAAVSMNCMNRLDLVTTVISRKIFYSCYLFNSLQFQINEFYIDLMLYQDVPIQYLDILKAVLIMLAVGIPMLIIFFLTRPEKKGTVIIHG